MEELFVHRNDVADFLDKPMRGRKPPEPPVRRGVPEIVAFVEKVAGFRLDAEQARMLRSTAKRGLWNCCRQYGKSTMTAGKAVHEALSHDGALILVASPCLRQSGEFLRKASYFVKKWGMPVRGDGDNASSLLLPNGSRICGVAGESRHGTRFFGGAVVDSG